MRGTAQARQDLQRLLRKLIAEYAPQQVILFGSHAYGEPDQHSDLDLLIVKETSETPFRRRVQVGRIVQDKRRKTPIQPLVITPQELTSQLEKGDPFLIEIMEKGEILYDGPRVPGGPREGCSSGVRHRMTSGTLPLSSTGLMTTSGSSSTERNCPTAACTTRGGRG